MGLFSSCAAGKRLEADVLSLRAENERLRSDQAGLRQDVNRLSETVVDLRDGVETLRLAIVRDRLEPALAQGKPQPRSAPVQPVEREPDPEPFLVGIPDSEASLPPIRLSNEDLESQSAPRPAQVAPTPVSSGLVDLETTRRYNDAFGAFESGRYGEAVALLSRFARDYPDHPYTDNALFWIGESHFRLKAYRPAAEQFERVVAEFGSGNKVPDALLRAGACYIEMNETEKARERFARLIKRYPESIAAKQARQLSNDLGERGSKGRVR